jgi:sporulation protein YabP
LSVVNREHVQLTGVVAVDSFDDAEVTVDTELGTLTIRGEELHIKQLDLETGRFEVEGYINSLQYSQPRQRAGRPGRGRGFLERLLR